MEKNRDIPFLECIEQANELVVQGAIVHQKFTCEKCGSRQTMSVPNVFYVSGQCEQCQEVTNILERGCGYVLILLGDSTPTSVKLN